MTTLNGFGCSFEFSPHSPKKLFQLHEVLADAQEHDRSLKRFFSASDSPWLMQRQQFHPQRRQRTMLAYVACWLMLVPRPLETHSTPSIHQRIFNQFWQPIKQLYSPWERERLSTQRNGESIARRPASGCGRPRSFGIPRNRRWHPQAAQAYCVWF